MVVKEVQDFYEIDVNGLSDNHHVIYEKINQIEPILNGKNQVVGQKTEETYELISVYYENGSLIKKASYKLGQDVNNVAEALGIISRLYVNKLSA